MNPMNPFGIMAPILGGVIFREVGRLLSVELPEIVFGDTPDEVEESMAEDVADALLDTVEDLVEQAIRSKFGVDVVIDFQTLSVDAELGALFEQARQKMQQHIERAEAAADERRRTRKVKREGRRLQRAIKRRNRVELRQALLKEPDATDD
jgi:hypothetical protein